MNRALTLSGMAALGAAMFLACLYTEQYRPGAVLLAPAALAAGLVILAACQGKRWALKVCLIAFILTIDASFRETGAVRPGFDGQILLKMAVAFGILVVGLANLDASLRYYCSLPATALLMYLLLALASAFYSPVPMSTLQNAASFIGVFLFAGALVAKLEFREILATSLLALGVHVVLALLLAAANATPMVWMITGEDGTTVRLKGLTGHALRFADMCALFVLCAWIMWRRGWLSAGVLIAVAMLGVAALLMARERMPVAAFLLAFVSLGHHRGMRLAGLAGLALLIVTAATSMPTFFAHIASAISRTGNPEGLLSLSGRLNIWGDALDVFMQRPFLGHGFTSAGYVLAADHLARGSKALSSSAEGVFTQSLVGLGLVGTALLIVLFAHQIVFALRHRDSALNPFICYAFLSGLTTSSTIGGAPNTLTLFWIMALCLTGFATASRTDADFITCGAGPDRSMTVHRLGITTVANEHVQDSHSRNPR